MLFAILLVALSFWFSNTIVKKVAQREIERVEQWADAVKRKADLVNLTNNAFEELRACFLGKPRDGVVDFALWPSELEPAFGVFCDLDAGKGQVLPEADPKRVCFGVLPEGLLETCLASPCNFGILSDRFPGFLQSSFRLLEMVWFGLCVDGIRCGKGDEEEENQFRAQAESFVIRSPS